MLAKYKMVAYKNKSTYFQKSISSNEKTNNQTIIVIIQMFRTVGDRSVSLQLDECNSSEKFTSKLTLTKNAKELQIVYTKHELC